LRAVALALLLCSASRVFAETTKRESCQAEVFVPESLARGVSVPSPDGRFRVMLEDRPGQETARMRVFQDMRSLGEYSLRDLSAGIFLKWSPDSRAFYLMWSDGGAIGAYAVRVFRVSSDAATEVFSTRPAEREFKRRHDCRTRGINVYAVKWLGASDRLLIAAEVYPTGDCGKELGFTLGYAVRVEDGAILERYSARRIGQEMRSCPSQLWPTGLWDDADLQKGKAELDGTVR
jgi:hypothetical protein